MSNTDRLRRKNITWGKAQEIAQEAMRTSEALRRQVSQAEAKAFACAECQDKDAGIEHLRAMIGELERELQCERSENARLHVALYTIEQQARRARVER